MHDLPRPGAFPIVIAVEVIGSMGESSADSEKCTHAATDVVLRCCTFAKSGHHLCKHFRPTLMPGVHSRSVTYTSRLDTRGTWSEWQDLNLRPPVPNELLDRDDGCDRELTSAKRTPCILVAGSMSP